jgi:hypothetical protein
MERKKFAVEGAITSNLTLVAKLLGQLIQHHDVRHTSILINPDYLRAEKGEILFIKSATRPFIKLTPPPFRHKFAELNQTLMWFSQPLIKARANSLR